jgi:NitT/TauT family transport system permease protein
VLKIRVELAPTRRQLLSAVSVVAFLLLWWLLTWPLLPPLDAPTATVADALAEDAAEPASVEPQPRPIIPAYILPSPQAVLSSVVVLHREHALVRSAARSLYRITLAFLLAALVAIPIGLVMGTWPPIRNVIEPLTGPLRYLPISAVYPLFILWFGIGDTMKVAFLFVGIVVYLLPLVIESVMNVDQVYLDTAYTLGARPRQIIFRVLLPCAWPGIFEAGRVLYGVGWTYVILAELINAEYGLGYLLTQAQRRQHIDWIYALILVVLLLGVSTNYIFVFAGKRLFAWKEAKP